jgi:hypothetical protein
VRGHRLFAYTLTVGLVVLSAVFEFISTRLDHGPLMHSSMIVFLLLASAGAVACFVVNVYRLRIDERGVHVRTLLGWDLWTWDEFASGNVEQERLSVSFVEPSRPFLRRKLRVALFEEAPDILGAIGAHWQPAPIETPDTVEISDWVFSSRGMKMQLTSQGVEVTDRTGERTYAWSDLTEAVLHRPSVYHQRFSKAVLRFPDETVSLGSFKGDGNKAWIGPDAEVIEAFLRQHVDEERIRVRTKYGPPADMEDIEERIAFAALQMRRLAFIAPILAALLGVLPAFFYLLFAGVGEIEAAAISVAVVGVPMSILFCWIGRRDWRRHIAELEAWRKELAAATEGEVVTNDEELRD